MNIGINAICVLNPDYLKSNSKVNGIIYLDSMDESTHIYGTIYGLNPNTNFTSYLPKSFIPLSVDSRIQAHAIHIHEFGDLSSGCDECCSHYNPFNRNHGSPDVYDRHVGDLGNIIANAQGIATIDIMDDLVKLHGPYNVIGRSIVIHADADDMGLGGHADSLITGHAGKRLACGVIGYRKIKI
jgi:Cu-Zn family superoxide dismutase